MCEVINVRDADNGALYIGRPRKSEPLTQTRAIWGNPYVVRDADAGRIIRSCGIDIETKRVRDEATAIQMFRGFLNKRVQDGDVSLEELAGLQGRKLACFCSPRPCHGDVLKSASEWAAAQVGTVEDVYAESEYADIDLQF